MKIEWICDQNGRLINLNYVTDIQLDGNAIVAHMSDNRLIWIAKCTSVFDCQKIIDKLIGKLENVMDI